MTYFDRYPNRFRAIFGIVALCLLAIAGWIFNQFLSSPNDENFFTEPPSKLYIKSGFSSSLHSSAPNVQSNRGEEAGNNAVLPGEFLTQINDVPVKTKADVEKILSGFQSPTLISVVSASNVQQKIYYRQISVYSNEIPSDFLIEIPSGALVIEVVPNGASDRAGMLEGDLILRVNKRSFRSIFEADKIMRSVAAGETIEYDIFRAGTTLTLHVTLAKYGVQFGVILTYLAGLLYICIGLFLGFARARFVGARLIGILFLLIGILLQVMFSPNIASSQTYTVLRALLILVCSLIALPLWNHSNLYFPTHRPEILRRKWIIVLPYIIALAGISLILIADGRLFPQILPSIIAGLLLIYTIGVPIFFRKSHSVEAKKMAKPLSIAGASVGILSGLLSTPILVGSLQRTGFIALTLCFIPLSYLYVIGRYRLFDLNIRLRRNIQYSAVSLLWGLFLGGVFVQLLLFLPKQQFDLPNIRLTGASVEILKEEMLPEKAVFLEKLAIALLAISGTYLLWKLGEVGSKFIDRKFYRGKYDYRKSASELSSALANTVNIFELAKNITHKIADLMKLKHIGLLVFRNGKDFVCQEFFDSEGETIQPISTETAMELLHLFNDSSSPLNTRAEMLPKELRSQLTTFDFRAFIPIFSKDKTISGIVMIGEKRSETALDREDFAFLDAISKQISVSLENALLYENFAEQERIKRELEIARNIQLASLPQKTPDVAGLDIAGGSVPALEVGGDFFDYLNGKPDEITVVVGDVSGKGTSAALYMSKIQGILRSLNDFSLSPRDLFIRTNYILTKDLEKKSYVTALCGRFDLLNRKISVVRAGHLPLYHFSQKKQRIERILPRGLGLGLTAKAKDFDMNLEERMVSYEKGDVFLFVSDGITEANNLEKEEFGEKRMEEILHQATFFSAEEIRCALNAALERFVGIAPQHDDMTVVVIKAG